MFQIPRDIRTYMHLFLILLDFGTLSHRVSKTYSFYSFSLMRAIVQCTIEPGCGWSKQKSQVKTISPRSFLF
ncbi:MAG: hypothetical protein K0S53_801 [Bacteroidetes bacterium]|nr:hypothetical protein [Bacteroidota bacterium]